MNRIISALRATGKYVREDPSYFWRDRGPEVSLRVVANRVVGRIIRYGGGCPADRAEYDVDLLLSELEVAHAAWWEEPGTGGFLDWISARCPVTFES